eukprot:CAMPEP_0177625244 /NCGR_PEP_ID=MMETSP0419_2-20121207/29981_1 /TAXON_ID=582737 /ORGANISM="Tetraselmis sp., Strain GSL018" /LENGTH=450 /DNA_ID=CAMNT_0019126147 /DNA_START=349 /DNA_END=1701 /DNA_ORIENTATION=-
MTTPTAWENSTYKQVATADTQRQWSTGARAGAVDVQNFSKNKNKTNQEAVSEAFLQKTHETEQLIELLNQTLRTVNHEIAELESIPTKRIESYIRQTEQKIELNAKRMEVRTDRPKTERVDDEVHGQLLNMDSLLRHNLAELLHCRKGIQQDLRLLRESRAQLEMDLANKKAALSVDTNLMRHDETGGDLTLTGGPCRCKMTIDPLVWTGGTKALVKTALQRQGDAAKLRAAINNICQEVSVTDKTGRQNLQLATMDKICKTQGLKSTLEMERNQVMDELNQAKIYEKNLCEDILNLEDDLDNTRRKYMYRCCQRPDKEKVVDQVELNMRRTLQEQKALHKNLMNSKPTLASNIQGLHKSLSKLEKNILDKDEAMKADRNSLLIDGRKSLSQAPSDASYRTSYVGGGSHISSKAESLKSRISELEGELAQTRKKNHELEAKKSALTSKGY